MFTTRYNFKYKGIEIHSISRLVKSSPVPMPPNLFDQPFVHCGVCHRLSSPDDPLYLTSCAHTLCSQHMNVKVCPVCHICDVLVIKLTETKPLPDEIKILFQPIPSLLENLHNVSQFQITGLFNQCHYYQDLCSKLREKCARQRQLLFQAKGELDSVAQLKARVAELESLLQSSPSISSVFSASRSHKRAPDTVDLTLEESPSHQEESFIRKLKTTNSFKNRRHTVELPQSSDNSRTASAIAESTQLDKSAIFPSVHRAKQSNAEPQTACSSQTQFPSALNKLRIVKRNHTFNNNNIVLTRNSQGLVPHMRSSSSGIHAQTQTGLLMRKNTISRTPAGASQGNNKFRRVR